MNGRLITILCGLAIAGSACNRYVPVLDSPSNPTGPTLPTLPPASIVGVRISPGAVNAGESVRGTVLLDGPAAAPGVNVTLSTSDDAARVDPMVTIPPGSSNGEFAISTRVVPEDRQVVITATTAGRSASSTVMVWADVPVFFKWFSEPGESIGSGGYDRLTPPTSNFTAFCDRNTLNVQIRAGSEFWLAMFSGPAGVPLRSGAYEGATRAPFNSATPGLSISGRGRGCNTLGGRFVIHDIDLQNNRVNRFHASWVQRCGNDAGLLSGEIRVLNMPPSSSVVSCQR
jgi:hypothetical protein